MILAFKVGMRMMLNNDWLGNTQVLDSSSVPCIVYKQLQ
jgi:hypothetical protein